MEEKKFDGDWGKRIKGIKCCVEHCYYNENCAYCTANEIAVGPRGADCSGDTLCATFKPKAE